MLPVTTMSRPGRDFSAATSANRSPRSTVEFAQPGSVIVDDITYFVTWLR